LTKFLIRLYLFFRFIHLASFSFTVILPLLGIATVSSGVNWMKLAGLLAVALAFHIFAYVFNDVIDLPVDRLHPNRSMEPLVRGKITPGQALMVAFLQVPVAFGVTRWLNAPPLAYLALAWAFTGMTIYDLFGKKTSFPPLTDAIQGLAWASLVIYGAAVAGGYPSGLSWLVAGFMVIYVILLNGIHASLRDIASDQKAGLLTTALMLGARPLYPRGLQVPRRLVVYMFSLQGVLAVINLLPLFGSRMGPSQPAWWWVLAGILFLQAVCLLFSYLAVAETTRINVIIPAGGYTIASLLSLSLLFLSQLEPRLVWVFGLAYVLPLVITGLLLFWGQQAGHYRLHETHYPEGENASIR
jgi:4-hydroxybenzoate polyprenyltransferase